MGSMEKASTPERVPGQGGFSLRVGEGGRYRRNAWCLAQRRLRVVT